jgi:phosphohistidine phosphatase
MPRLLLLRHAEAERTQPGSTDHERALTPRGCKNSAAIGKTIAERGEQPDLVLCSTSKRTRDTWDAVKPTLDQAPESRFLRSLYESGGYLDILRQEGGAARSILLIGHNPAMQETAVLLAADLAGRDGARLRDGFPKAALAVFDFDGSWREIGHRRMRLEAFIPPDRS